MSCKICGRNSCTESFHSIREQSENEPEYLRERIAALTAERDKLREIVEYVLAVWEGSIYSSTDTMHEWIDKARKALEAGK